MKLYTLEDVIKSDLEEGIFVPYDKNNETFINKYINGLKKENNEIEISTNDIEYNNLEELFLIMKEYVYVFIEDGDRGELDEEF